MDECLVDTRWTTMDVEWKLTNIIQNLTNIEWKLTNVRWMVMNVKRMWITTANDQWCNGHSKHQCNVHNVKREFYNNGRWQQPWGSTWTLQRWQTAMTTLLDASFVAMADNHSHGAKHELYNDGKWHDHDVDACFLVMANLDGHDVGCEPYSDGGRPRP